ncbi:MAG: class I SAM-dependent methyltransferase [Sphingomonadaceae bacterium]|nr:class I SAM-dependent methyltransferase [Sphingomonadaceae bacterium]
MTNSSREYLARYNRRFATDAPPGSLVLDAGAGEQQYRPYFSHCNYESADFEMVDKPYAKSTYVCDLGSIPVEDGRFDRIIFNQVQEHLPDPLAVLRELNRVLKPGGKLLCTAPLFYEEHERPFDFYRYTQFAHRHLMERAGFQIDWLEWMEGYFGTLGYQFQGMAQHIPANPVRYLKPSFWPIFFWPFALFVKASAVLLAASFYRLDLAMKITDRGYPKNYALVVTKN